MQIRIGFVWIALASLALPVQAQCTGGGPRGGSVAGTFNPLGGTSGAGLGSPLANFAAINAYQSQLAQQRYIIAMQQAALQQAYQQQAYQQMMNQTAAVTDGQAQSGEMGQNRTVSVADFDDKLDSARPTTSPRRSATRSRRRNAEAMLTVADRARENGNADLAVKNYRKILKMLPEEDDINQRALARLQEVTATR